MLVIVNGRSQTLDRISFLYDDEQAFLLRKIRDANIEMSQSFPMRSKLSNFRINFTLHFSFVVRQLKVMEEELVQVDTFWKDEGIRRRLWCGRRLTR